MKKVYSIRLEPEVKDRITEKAKIETRNFGNYVEKLIISDLEKDSGGKKALIGVVTNRYFHELEQKEVDTLIADKKTTGYIMENYKQPNWCKSPNALEGKMGCWSLMDLSKDGLRTKISKDFCKGCECFSLGFRT